MFQFPVKVIYWEEFYPAQVKLVPVLGEIAGLPQVVFMFNELLVYQLSLISQGAVNACFKVKTKSYAEFFWMIYDAPEENATDEKVIAPGVKLPAIRENV